MSNNKEKANSTITSDSLLKNDSRSCNTLTNDPVRRCLQDYDTGQTKINSDNILFMNKEKDQKSKGNTSGQLKSGSLKKTGKRTKKKAEDTRSDNVESCARTYLAYHSVHNNIETVQTSLSVAPLSPSIINDGDNVQNDVVLSDTVSLSGKNGLSDSLMLSDASSNEMFINTDALSTDSQQPIFLSNVILQVSEECAPI